MFSRILSGGIGFTKHVRIRTLHSICGTPKLKKLTVKPSIAPQIFGFTIRSKTTQSGKPQDYAYRPIQGIIVVWNNIFGKYLLVTNTVGSGLLMVVGDVMAQEIEYRKGPPKTERYDLARMGRMFIVGALQGPLHHYVYNWMDRIMPVVNARNIIQKILIDQIFMSPACILIFFYSACYLERKSLKETNDELRQKFLFIYCMDWLLWPGAQYINFRYLDTKYRVTFVNVCTALYNVFISYVKHDYELPDQLVQHKTEGGVS